MSANRFVFKTRLYSLFVTVRITIGHGCLAGLSLDCPTLYCCFAHLAATLFRTNASTAEVAATVLFVIMVFQK